MRTIGYPAFALGWEQQPGIDECGHDWERLRLHDAYGPGRSAEVERCTRCGVPRCGSSNAAGSPCTDRRHHDSLHIYADGSFEPLGGILS